MEQINRDFEKQEISAKELFFVIKRNFTKLSLSIFAFMFFALIYLAVVRPIYITSASIIIEGENSTMSSLFDMGLGSDKNYLENEIEVLKSRTTSERAIQALLNSKFKDNLNLFSTYKHEYSFIQKTLRNVLFIDWNDNSTHKISESINDTLFNLLTKKFTEPYYDGA